MGSTKIQSHDPKIQQVLAAPAAYKQFVSDSLQAAFDKLSGRDSESDDEMPVSRIVAPNALNLLSFALAVASPTGASTGFAALPAFCLGSVTTSPDDDIQRNSFWEVSSVNDVVVNLAHGLEAVGELSSTPHHGHPLDLGIDLDRPSADSALNGGPDVGDVSILSLEGFASIDATTLMSFGIELGGDALVNISSTVLPVLRPPLDAGVDTRLVAQVRPATSLVSVFGPSGCVRVSGLLAPCGAAVLASRMTSPGAFITSADPHVVAADPTSWGDVSGLSGCARASMPITPCSAAVLASLMSSPDACFTSTYSRVLAADPYERRSPELLRLLDELGIKSHALRFKAGDVDDTRLESLTKPELRALGLPVGPFSRLAAALGLRPLSGWSLQFCRSPSAPSWARAVAGYRSRRTTNAESFLAAL